MQVSVYYMHTYSYVLIGLYIHFITISIKLTMQSLYEMVLTIIPNIQCSPLNLEIMLIQTCDYGPR